MDFQNLLKDATNIAKQYGEKVVNFSEEHLKKTPAFLKTLAEFESVAHSKKLLVFVWTRGTPEYTEALAWFPIFGAKAWMWLAALKYVERNEASEVALRITDESRFMFVVYHEGSIVARYYTLHDVKAFFQDPCFDAQKDYSAAVVDETKSPQVEVSSEAQNPTSPAPVDPLSSNNQ